jgi:hypothetical protein
MKMPKHMSAERNAHYIERHNRRLRATAVGANLTDEAKRINAARGSEVFSGGIGETVIKTGSFDGKGNMSVRDTVLDARDVKAEDLQEMASVKAAQAKDAEVNLEGESPPTSVKKSKK